MRIPTQEECYGLIKEMGMMDHIVDHSRQVCRVAVCLTQELNRQEEGLNIDLVRAAALLHDITKTRSFETREDHALTGAEFLRRRGFHEVGQVVGQHVNLDVYSGVRPLMEAEIVNYADKRVLHDRIVPLAERMIYIMERYADGPESRARIQALWSQSEALEKKLFGRISFAPQILKQVVNACRI